MFLINDILIKNFKIFDVSTNFIKTDLFKTIS
jgi:hypothetical protein